MEITGYTVAQVVALVVQVQLHLLAAHQLKLSEMLGEIILSNQVSHLQAAAAALALSE